jgi:dTDP-4-amino-4,6-dideoxygalactose transaminase
MHARYAVALDNGTVALELALRAVGVRPGDEVIVPARTFVATASAAVAVGATPKVVDVDRDSGAMTADTVKQAVTDKTKAIVPVHLAGWPAPMRELKALAEEIGAKVVEDCAQAHGAQLDGRNVGTYGDAAAWSFCQDKILTTAGEGAMVTTDDERVWRHVWEYKDHGKSYDAVYNRKHEPGFKWLHESFGTNARMTEVQAAIGRKALEKLEDWSATRRNHAKTLDEGLQDVEALRVTTPPANVRHAYYKYYAYVRPERLEDGWTRDKIMRAITAEGIPALSGSCSEIYLEKAFDQTGRPQERLPIAKELGETSLLVHVHPTLTANDIEDTVAAIRKVMAVAGH